MSAKTFLIMAGGTGGHVYPALGFADYARSQGHSVSWLGTDAGLEARVVPAKDIDLHTIEISGVRGKGKLALLAAPWRITKAVQQAKKVLKSVKPDLVIGFGGYIAGPGGVASKLSGIPLVIHEQNAIAGTTNRLLNKFATRSLCAFQGALPKSETVGNPIRSEILSLVNQSSGVDILDTEGSRPKMLVIGGSLGARFLNESVPQVLAKLDASQRPVVRHQAGPKLIEEARQSYASASVEAEVTAYIEDMAEAYKWADLVICRAGAMTVSELAAAGVASVLVPFPFAIDDHQTANANWLVEAGAARVYQQSENDLESFSKKIIELLSAPEKLIEMSEKASERAVRDSTQRILTICEEVA